MAKVTNPPLKAVANLIPYFKKTIKKNYGTKNIFYLKKTFKKKFPSNERFIHAYPLFP